MNDLNLSSVLKTYNYIDFIFLHDAEKLINKFNRKNRKLNNNIEYQLNEAKNNLYIITRNKGGWCGDSVVKVVTTDEYNEVVNKILN